MMEGKDNHVKLYRAPLKRVICQLRYPTVLGFDAATVRPFQQAIEDEYPTVQVEKIVVGVVFVRSDSGPNELDLKDVFRFAVAGGHTTVAISEDSLSLETVEYDRFSHFANRWEQILAHAITSLKIRRQARLGLRYTNVIEREDFDKVEDWSGLVADHLLEPVRAMSHPIGATPFAEQHVVRLRTAHGGVTFRHGFPTPPEENLPSGYFIDIDNYDDEPKTISVREHLEQLTTWDDQSYAMLRASVTDAQWSSFDPEGV